MTLIAVNRKLSVEALLDIENAEFAHQYGLGVWWAMYGDEQSKGQYEDRYLIENISHGISKGYYDDLASHDFAHLGFYLGMVHGGNIDPKTYELNKSTSIVKLTDSDFTRGYNFGQRNGERLTENAFIRCVNLYSIACYKAEELAYELGRLMGILSFALKPVILPETASQVVQFVDIEALMSTKT